MGPGSFRQRSELAFEVSLLEFEHPRVLGDNPLLFFAEPAAVPRVDLHRDLQLGLRIVEMRQDLKLQVLERLPVPFSAYPQQAVEMSGKNFFPERPRTLGVSVTCSVFLPGGLASRIFAHGDARLVAAG